MAAKSFASYIKAAFRNQWNLLVVGAGAAFAFISGHPDIALPVLAAGELAYLVTTAGHPRFQHYIDNVRGKIEKKQANVSSGQRFQELYAGLDEASRSIWDGLRGKCTALTTADELGGPLDAIATEQAAGVNKLLWVHLKLLHTRMRLGRFLASTDEREIDRGATEAARKLAALPAAGADAITDKKRKSLEDLVATLKTRKTNLARAKENYELVELELGRISAKLQGVVELAANRHDPGALTSEVDDAAASVTATEQMMGELAMFTGLTAEDTDAPEIIGVPAKAAAAARARRVPAG